MRNDVATQYYKLLCFARALSDVHLRRARADAGHHATPHTDMADTVSLIHMHSYPCMPRSALFRVCSVLTSQSRRLASICRRCVSFSHAFTTKSKLTTVKARKNENACLAKRLNLSFRDPTKLQFASFSLFTIFRRSDTIRRIIRSQHRE